MPRKSKHTSVKEEEHGNKLPAHLEDQRTRVTVGLQAPTNVKTQEHHAIYQSLGFDNSFDFESWKEQFSLEIKSLNEEEIVFDMKGVDAPIANALRRILISEVPTMAIETVYIANNTSIIPDEVIAHRLGLIPIKADPRLFDTHKQGEDLTDRDTIVFNLDITCERIPGSREADPEEKKYKNSRVYSSDLVWIPQGEQSETYADAAIRPVYEDIPIAKLRPGQTIKLVCYCEKNIGKEHAKWSPVATATYRLMPAISFKQPVKGPLAQELVEKCPMNVFDIEDSYAVVARPRNCTMCRECIREPEWDARVLLQKEKQHFIFSVESVGIIPPEVIVEEAMKTLIERIQAVANAFEELKNPSSVPPDVSQLEFESEI